MLNYLNNLLKEMVGGIKLSKILIMILQLRCGTETKNPVYKVQLTAMEL
jgi:hypothetical protein